MTNNLELDLKNIPLNRLWFDTADLREKRNNNYMQDIAWVIQSSCDNIPEVKQFKSLMNNFFIGKVEFVENNMYIPEAFNVTEEISDEIYDVIQNHIEYPDDENLRSHTFTQEINNKIGNDLSKYGVVLDNKYWISTRSDFFYIHPLFHISDPDLFIEFLQKIKFCDKEVIKHIDTIFWAHESWVENFFISWNEINDSMEISNFMIRAFSIWEEIERLEIEESLINIQVRDFALVTSNGLLQEYLDFKKLWFFAQLYPDDFDNTLKIPIFIYDVLDICSQYDNLEDLNNCIKSIQKYINKSLVLLKKTKKQTILFQPLKKELQFWINQFIEYIDANPNIEIKEKSRILKPIDNQAQELDLL